MLEARTFIHQSGILDRHAVEMVDLRVGVARLQFGAACPGCRRPCELISPERERRSIGAMTLETGPGARLNTLRHCISAIIPESANQLRLK